MVDEPTTTPEPTPEPTPSPEPTPQPSPAPVAPGEIDWRATIQDENLRKSTEKYTSLDALVQSHNQLGGELKNRVKVPGADAKPEDIAKFRKAIGVPDKEDGYTVEVEGVEFDAADTELIDMLKPVAFKHNIPAGAFKDFIVEFKEMSDTIREELKDEITTARAEAEVALKKEWGGDYEKNQALAPRAAKAHGGDEFVEFLQSTKLPGGGALGDHPTMVKFLSTIGRKSDEAEMVMISSAAEAESAQSEINRLNREVPVGSEAYKDPEHQKRLQALYAKVAGNAPIVGAQGRAA
jgi:hypothetical protein